MLSNALDDECTGRSPCRGCKWHLQGLDKNQCVDKCERLAAYRNGEPWEGLDVPMHEHGGKEPDFAMLRRSGKEIVEMEEIEEKEINIEHVSRHSIAKPDPTSNVQHRMEKQRSVIPADTEIQGKRSYHKTITQFRGLLNKEAGGKCLIDTCETENGLIRGLCTKHYQAWRKGYIKHPILSEFTVFQAKSHRRSKVGGAAGIFKESADQGKKIQVKIIPIEETRGQKIEIDEPIIKTPAEMPPGKIKRIRLPAGLFIDLDKFPKTKTAIHDTAEKYFVTPEHVIISLLGEALVARESSKD